MFSRKKIYKIRTVNTVRVDELTYECKTLRVKVYSAGRFRMIPDVKGDVNMITS